MYDYSEFSRYFALPAGFFPERYSSRVRVQQRHCFVVQAVSRTYSSFCCIIYTYVLTKDCLVHLGRLLLDLEVSPVPEFPPFH